MAHASKTDALKIHMKKLRAQRAKKKLAEQQMDPVEKAERDAKRAEITLDSRFQTMMWDYKNKQLTRLKYHLFREILTEKLNLIKIKNVKIKEDFNQMEEIEKILEDIK